jgi:hypothetical protein
VNIALAAMKLKHSVKMYGNLTYCQCIAGAKRAAELLAVIDPHDIAYVKLVEVRNDHVRHATLMAIVGNLKASEHVDTIQYLVDDKKGYVEEFIARVPLYTHRIELDKTIRTLFIEERIKDGVIYTGLERGKIEFLAL